MIQAGGGVSKIMENFFPDIFSTTDQCSHICNKQHGSIRHATSEVNNNMNSAFLYCFQLLSLLFCQSIMPNWDTIFENWSYN